MIPLPMECTAEISCCVCEKELETISTLHHHQMNQHTMEELSLALLTLKGLDISGEDLNESQKNDVFLSCTSMLDEISELTGEPSRLVGAITTLDGKIVPPPKIRVHKKNINLADRIQSPSSGISILENRDLSNKENQFDNIGYELQISINNNCKPEVDVNNMIDRSPVLVVNRKRRSNMHHFSSPDYEGNLMLLCTSDDGWLSSGVEQFDSETDTDVEKEQTIYSENDVKSEVTTVIVLGPQRSANNELDKGIALVPLDSTSSSEHVNNTDIDCIHVISKKNSNSNVEETALLNGIDLECTEESRPGGVDTPVKSEPCSSLSESSLDSLLSPSNSPRPESSIAAIITRLPTVVLPDCNSERMKSSSKFVLPSPVGRHHRNNVFYDYSQGKSDSSPLNDGHFEDFFIPTIQFSPMRGKTDASCSTTSMEFKEKHVQTNSVIIQDVDCQKTDTNTVKSKSTSVSESKRSQNNSTVQKLALFRKNKANKTQESKKNPESTLDKTVVPKTISSTSVQEQKTLSHRNVVKSTGDGGSSSRLYPLGVTDRRFFCEPCGKGYKKKSHLERHLRVHTGERPFPCSFCEKRFAVRSILKQHIRIHTGEKPYSCSVCSQRFPQKSGLMTHMMLHTGKPFKCDLCEKSFVSNHKLLQHLRCHDNLHAHMCRTCNVEFFTAGALSEHDKFHAQKNSYECMMCGESFVQELFLKLHLDEHLNGNDGS